MGPSSDPPALDTLQEIEDAGKTALSPTAIVLIVSSCVIVIALGIAFAVRRKCKPYTGDDLKTKVSFAGKKGKSGVSSSKLERMLPSRTPSQTPDSTPGTTPNASPYQPARSLFVQPVQEEEKEDQESKPIPNTNALLEIPTRRRKAGEGVVIRPQSDPLSMSMEIGTLRTTQTKLDQLFPDDDGVEGQVALDIRRDNESAKTDITNIPGALENV